MSDPEAPRSSDLAPDVAPGATVRLKIGQPEDPFGTQRLARTDPALAASTLILAQHSDETQKLSLPPLSRPDATVGAPAGDPRQDEAQPGTALAPRTGGWKIPLLIGSLVVVGATAYLVFARGQAPQAPVVAKDAKPEPIPEAAKLYLEQAQAGDAHAMRMLGVMYYYGLNVPQDREKGRLWYRKAAEKGSDAAREELRKLESGS